MGPILSDIAKLAKGKRFTLASAFYSAARLDEISIDAASVELMVRLDLRSIEDWVARAIAPDALLRCWQKRPDTEMAVYYSPTAHAKAYVGDGGFLVGSANLTVRGLAGTTDEILWFDSRAASRKQMEAALTRYKEGLSRLTIKDLERYVHDNIDEVHHRQRLAVKSEEDSVPGLPRRPTRLGTYEAFLMWLTKQNGDGARVVLERAHGRGQLSGHIRTNFFGIRQFLLATPSRARYLSRVSPSDYQLWRDVETEKSLERFVRGEAVDEGGLIVDIWRTYLPERSGGKPKSGGGTSGNLNRMLPLMARYLKL